MYYDMCLNVCQLTCANFYNDFSNLYPLETFNVLTSPLTLGKWPPLLFCREHRTQIHTYFYLSVCNPKPAYFV